MISRNRLKYLTSLKIKKLRTEHRQFIMEGDKIVTDILKEGQTNIRQLIATNEWYSANHRLLSGREGEIIEADITDLQRVSSLETPPPVIAVMDMFEQSLNLNELADIWCIALDTVQDPGNLGTIIRSADWFGIRHIVCNDGCADYFNPKVIQASMGAMLRVKLYYEDLATVMKNYANTLKLPVYGTYMDGMPVYDIAANKSGMIVFGNESRGISDELTPFISARIAIPPGSAEKPHIESLNVASAVSVVCSVISRM